VQVAGHRQKHASVWQQTTMHLCFLSQVPEEASAVYSILAIIENMRQFCLPCVPCIFAPFQQVAEEASAVYNVLAIIENMIEVRPDIAEQVVAKTKLLKWLLARLRPRETDSNKQYASEILAILVQQSDANKRKMGASNGIDAVLQAIAPYRNRDPETTEEEELVENLFDVLASCLLLEDNKAVFVEAEGVELLLLILKGKRAARTSALKCLDFATTRCPPACDRTVDQQGLKTLFAIFMGKLKVKRKDESAAGEEEERTVSIIASLLNQCTKQASWEGRVGVGLGYQRPLAAQQGQSCASLGCLTDHRIPAPPRRGASIVAPRCAWCTQRAVAPRPRGRQVCGSALPSCCFVHPTIHTFRFLLCSRATTASPPSL
jgi:hypothetical protein